MTTPLPPLPFLAPLEPPKRTAGGRPLGSRDRVSRPLKEAILLAAEEAGDVLSEAGATPIGGLAGYLTMVATTDVKAFCGLLGRVLPLTLSGENGGPITVEIVRLANGANPTA